MSTETTPDRLEISGKDNFGQPRQDFAAATYDETRRRANLDLYQRGWNRAAGHPEHGETGISSGTSI